MTDSLCQDNEISWIDWTLIETHKDLFRFFKNMIRFRKSHPVLRRTQYFFEEKDDRGWPAIAWHGVKLGFPDWSYDSHTLAYTLSGLGIDNDIHVILNMWTEGLSFELPVLEKGRHWYRTVDTFQTSPNDIAEQDLETPVPDMQQYFAGPRSVVVLISK